LKNKKELAQKLLALSKQHRLATSITGYLNKSLDKHIQRLKYIESPTCTKKKWVEQAIEEKLSSKLDLDEAFQEKQIILHLSPENLESLKNRVRTLKKIHRSYSYKKLIEEAIYEKLEREEQKTRALLEEKFQSV
jgi:hypothetical protein